MAAPVYQSDAFASWGSGTNPWTITAPATVNAGDLLIAIANTGTSGVLSGPTGWSAETQSSSGAVHYLTKVADGSEGGTTLSFSWNNGGHSGSLMVIRVSGAASVAPIEAESDTRPFTSGSITIPTLTTLGPNRLVIMWLGVENSGVLRTWTPPSGWTSGHANANTGWQGATYWEAFAAAGAIGDQTVTVSGGSVTYDGVLLAIVPAGGAAQTISPSGIASAQAFGTPTVTVGSAPQTISPSGIASAQAFGTPTVAVGPGRQTISPSGIASAQAFGATAVQLGPAPVVVTVGAGPGGGLDFHVTGLWYPGASRVPYYGRIADPIDGEVVIPLNDSRTAGVTVSLYDPIARDLVGHTYARCLKVYYHGHLVFWGPCKLIDIDMAAGTARLNAVDPTLRLIRHYLRRGDLGGNLNQANDDRYPVTVDASGLGLLRDAAKNIPGQTARGVPDLGIGDGDNYYPASPDDLIGVARGDEVFNAMRQLCESLGPDMEFEPTEDFTGLYCLMNTWRVQGSDKSDRVQLHWGTGRDNLTSLTVQEGAKYTTHVHVLSRDLRYRFTEADLDTSADTGPYVDWDATDYDAHGITAANVERVLRAYGDDILNAYGTPLMTYALEMPAEDDGSYLYLQDYRVGDLVDVAGRCGQVTLEGACRITSVALRQTGPDGGVQPELAVVPHRGTVFGDPNEDS